MLSTKAFILWMLVQELISMKNGGCLNHQIATLYFFFKRGNIIKFEFKSKQHYCKLECNVRYEMHGDG